MSEHTTQSRRTVVVGVDDSETSKVAQAYALSEARRHGLDLKVVRAYHWGVEVGFPAAASGVPVEAMVALRNEAEDSVAAVVEDLRSSAPEVQIESVVVEGNPADVLIDESHNAFLVVVGSRHLRGPGSFFLGSVGSTVAAKAHAPVIVVRGPSGFEAERAHIVAAVDGTERSEDVLSFAFDEASRAGLPVHAVSCWLPVPASLTALLDSSAMRSRNEAEIRLSEALAGWREKYPDVEVVATVIEGHAVATLVEKSYGQAMLVVGRGAKHPRIGSLFGSTSQGVLHHATCPVAVVGAS